MHLYAWIIYVRWLVIFFDVKLTYDIFLRELSQLNEKILGMLPSGRI